MTTLIHQSVAVCGLIALSIAVVYSILSFVAVITWRTRLGSAQAGSGLRPPITILKPLCGDEPGLYAHLRSFCLQAYPTFQIIFGVRDPSDPALVTARRLAAEFPELSIEVVVNPRLHGDNYKNSNLMNMLEVARYDVLVIADSDAEVRPDYLATVTAPLLDRNVGLVTCIYRGIPTQTLWSRLGAMYINEWFMPSVLFAWFFGNQSYASGQTLCLRRESLEAAGGLRHIANHLADDYRLGEMVRGLGLRIVLSSYQIEAEHHEATLRSLVRHQLRWMRTLRILRPVSFRFIFLTFSLPLAFLGLSLVSLSSVRGLEARAWALFGLTVGVQLSLHLVHRKHGGRNMLADLYLVPMRDALLCWTWSRTFFGSRVTWRGTEFNVDSRGVMRRAA